MGVNRAVFPNGFVNPVFIRGMSVLNTYPNNAYWVHSGTGVSSNSGKTSSKPLATITQALAKCTASKGDIILVMPGHAESIVAAGGLTLNKAGTSIIGLGSGEDRPIITFATDTAASILVSSANITVRNLVFKCNIASQNHMFDLKTKDFTLDLCEFREGTATGLSFITADTADNDSDRLKVVNCEFYAPTAGNYDNAIQLAKDFIGVRIDNCNFYGDFDDSCIDIPVGGNAQVDCTIQECTLVNLLSGSYVIKVNGTSSTGKIINCRVQTDAIGTAVDAGGLEMYNVIYNDGTDQTGWSPIVSQPDSTQNLIGADNNNNGFASTNVVANEDGSVLERLEQMQEVVNKGTGTALAANKSLIDALGSDGNAVTDSATSVLGAIGADNNNNAFSSSNVVANDDGSILERMESFHLRKEQLVSKAYAVLTGYDTAASFTVTGDVMVRVVGIVGATAITSTSGTTTLAVGTTEITTAILAASTIDNTQFAATDVWVDSSPANDSERMTEDWVIIGGGADIILTRSVDDITAGSLTLYCWWIPLSSGATVVAA